MMLYYVVDLDQDWHREWLGTEQETSHWMKQYWPIASGTRQKKMNWCVKWNAIIFIEENEFDNVVRDNSVHFVSV